MVKDSATEIPRDFPAVPGEPVARPAVPPEPRPSGSDAQAAIERGTREDGDRLWAVLREPLKAALDRSTQEHWRRSVDWRRAVERLARGSDLLPLPRQSSRRWPGELTLLLDLRSTSLVPLWREIVELVSRVRRVIGIRAVQVAEFCNDPKLPPHAWVRDKIRQKPLAWRDLQDRSVLAISDFGAADAVRHAAFEGWLRARAKAGTQVLALPLRANALPAAGRAACHLLHWQAATAADDRAVASLLALLAQCGEVSFPLLRSLATLVAGKAGAALAWQVWNHPMVEKLNLCDTRLAPNAMPAAEADLRWLPARLRWQAHRLRRLMQADLSEADEHMAVLRAEQLALPLNDAALWYELGDGARTQFEAELTLARHFLTEDWPARLRAVSAEQRDPLGAGFALLLSDAPRRLLETYAAEFGVLSGLVNEAALRRGGAVAVYGEVVLPSLPSDEGGARQSWYLRQQGAKLLAVPPERIAREVAGAGSISLPRHGRRLVRLPLQGGEGVVMQVEVAGVVRQHRLAGREPIELTNLSRVKGAVVRLRAPGREVVLGAVRRPSWADGFSAGAGGLRFHFSAPWGEALTLDATGGDLLRIDKRAAPAFGHDVYGLYMGLTLAGIDQRFRFIEPGGFWMGSPDGVGDDDEHPQHEVQLTRGYWLADTPCTQELWEALTGGNPSEFKEGADAARRPVEQVSWDDVQDFLGKLKEHLPEGVEGALPSEAQWEYAARAGSETAYWWGDEEESGRANWNGEQEGTTEVKKYEANPWGLYDVHGNVWEWCAGGAREYGLETESDPEDRQEQEVKSRALRGGAWGGPPGSARSACRSGDHRGYRWYGFGFRLALRCMSPARQVASEGPVLGAGGAAVEKPVHKPEKNSRPNKP